MNVKVLKVAAESNINTVADAIIKNLMIYSIVCIDEIGIKATYTTVKALIISNELLINEGYRVNIRPSYIDVKTHSEGDEIVKTAIRWTLVVRRKK